jgi:hypothetical protein
VKCLQGTGKLNVELREFETEEFECGGNQIISKWWSVPGWKIWESLGAGCLVRWETAEPRKKQKSVQLWGEGEEHMFTKRDSLTRILYPEGKTAQQAGRKLLKKNFEVWVKFTTVPSQRVYRMRFSQAACARASERCITQHNVREKRQEFDKSKRPGELLEIGLFARR